MSVHVIVTFLVKPDKLASFRALLEGVKRELPTAPGCIAVRIFNGSGEERVFVLVEHWESTDQHRAQLERIVSGGGWEHILSHLEIAPISNYYREL
jgi:quinol monooxygenase YgiN